MEGKKNRNRAILVVSFGTSHMDALEKSIERIELHIEEAFPECRVYRAFTSEMILRKLRRTKGLQFHTVKEAMEQMA